jgi:hypothetical protein
MSTRFAEPYWAAQKYMGNVPYGVAKAATDKMTRTHFINSRLCERRLGGCSARRGATQQRDAPPRSRSRRGLFMK